MLRRTLPDDTSQLLAITEETGVFKPYEIEALQEVLDDYHAVNHSYGHQAYTWLINDQPSAFIYLAPTAMTDRTWELWWIVVEKSLQGQGIGKQLLDYAEAIVQKEGGRLLLIETSSTPLYHPTRQFYLKWGYVACATIPDFYADGDGKVIFAKRLQTQSIA
jgi:GNAT superfamily N-acetyltransferase